MKLAVFFFVLLAFLVFDGSHLGVISSQRRPRSTSAAAGVARVLDWRLVLAAEARGVMEAMPWREMSQVEVVAPAPLRKAANGWCCTAILSILVRVL